MTYKFYDTCSLLLAANHLWEKDSIPVISSIVLTELEEIKTASNKDADVKFAARKIIHELENNPDSYECFVWKQSYIDQLNSYDLPLNNDSKIIISADIFAKEHPNDNVIFITNDLCCKHLAKIFGQFFEIKSYNDEDYDYSGYTEMYMTAEEMSDFYLNRDTNIYNLYDNEYLIIYSEETGEIVDRLCWTGETHRNLNYSDFNSNFFGTVKPMKNDVYQQLAFDSLSNNKITMIKGAAGTGKTFASLGFLLHKLERHQLDKIIIFCNTVATKNSAKLGFYPGTRDEKLLDSQIGNLLTSKFGSRIAVEQMMLEEKLVLLPLSDIRGYDTSGMRAGIYISEAQNLDIELMKLALQRIGEDCICIIDGDHKTQVDDVSFAGSSNGMKRVSQVFRGTDIYGEIELKNIHRSKIALIAENL